MNSNTAPASSPEARLSTVWRPETNVSAFNIDAANTAKAASNDNAARTERAPEQLSPSTSLLSVSLDVEAGRFVQTWKDASTEEVVWRYPSEAQLAFSRAVNAYQRALSGT